MKTHPQSDLLRDFLAELRTEEAGLVLHLVRCAVCQVDVEAVLAPAEQQGWTFSPRPRAEVDYAAVLRRVAAHREELRRLRGEHHGSAGAGAGRGGRGAAGLRLRLAGRLR